MNLRTLLSILMVFMNLAMGSAQAAFSVWAVNRTDVTVRLSLALQNGSFLETHPFVALLPGDSCRVLIDHFDTWFAYYLVFDNVERTDVQYQGLDAEDYRFAPPSGSRPNSNPRTTGYTGRYYTPVRFSASGSVYLITVEEVSTCRGRCINGEGTEYAYGEYFTTTWSAGLPNGNGVMVSADTTFTGAWQNGAMHGRFTIVATDGYDEKGRYVEGMREGDFTVKMPNGDRYEYHYVSGFLQGPQVMIVQREDAYGRERRTLWYDHGKPIQKPQTKKKLMLRDTPIER